MKFQCKCGKLFRNVRFPLVCKCKTKHADASDNQLVDGEPGIVVKMASATKAYTRWALNGFRERTDEERFALTLICSQCDKYNAEKNTCRVCGCGLPQKIKMATEKCPLGKWPKP